MNSHGRTPDFPETFLTSEDLPDFPKASFRHLSRSP